MNWHSYIIANLKHGLIVVIINSDINIDEMKRIIMAVYVTNKPGFAISIKNHIIN